MASNSIKVSFPVQNTFVPMQGPRALKVEIDWQLALEHEINLSLENQNGVINTIQCVWIDNRDGAWFRIHVEGTNQELDVYENTQGLWPILGANPFKARFEFIQSGISTDENPNVIFMNVPMDQLYDEWLRNITGNVDMTLDVATENLYRTSFINVGSTITTGGVAQIVTALTTRIYNLLQNPVNETEALWFAPDGSVPVIGSSLSLAVGQMYVSDVFISGQTFRAIAATTGHRFAFKRSP